MIPFNKLFSLVEAYRRFNDYKRHWAVFVTVSVAEEVEIPVGVSAIVTMSSGTGVVATALNGCTRTWLQS